MSQTDYVEAGCKVHVMYNHSGMMAHYRPGDKISVHFKVGFGEYRVKVEAMNLFFKGRMAKTEKNQQG